MKMKSNFPSAFQRYQPPSFKVYGSICIYGDKVLLVKGKKSQIWSFPKGHLKQSETQEECARRELLEETGLVSPKSFLGFYKFSAGSYFLYQFQEALTPQPRDTWEIDVAEWIPLSNLTSMHVNIDVSWFRSMLKNLSIHIHANDDDTVMTYLESPKAQHDLTTLWRKKAVN
jgi:8-oxo-dGTP pyrophosphatase MutT (NUDIX family)